MKIKGKERLARVLAQMPQAVRRNVRAQLEKSAKEITGFQKRLVPRSSGDLERSIGYTFGQYKAANYRVRGVSGGGGIGDPDLSVTIHAGDEKAFYAQWVEFGLSRSWTIKGLFDGATHPGFSAQPFFYPGYRMGAKRAKSGIKRAVRKGIKQAIGGKK